MQNSETNEQDVITPGAIASGASYSNRINPCEAVAGETRVTCRAGTGGELTAGPENYIRCNAIIIDAMHILDCCGYLPVLVRKSKIPIDIFAIRPEATLIIEVVRSRKALPDAPTVVRECRKEIDYLREMQSSSQIRKMLWVYSPQCRWRFYDVFPGGIWLAKDMMEGDGK
jgi:hypothetical protein